MTRYAIVANNLVTNIVMADAGYVPPDGVSVAIATDTYNVGDSYISGVFTAAPPPALTQAQLTTYAHDKATSIEHGGITINIGSTSAPINVECPTDTTTYSRLMALSGMASTNASLTQVYPFPSGNITLNATQIQTIYNAITNFYISVVNALSVVCNAIQAGTITTMAQIESASWPANS